MPWRPLILLLAGAACGALATALWRRVPAAVPTAAPAAVVEPAPVSAPEIEIARLLAGRLEVRCCPAPELVALSPDPNRPGRLLGIAWDLLESVDSGRTWRVIRRLRGPERGIGSTRSLSWSADGASLYVHTAAEFADDRRVVGWLSQDAGASFTPVPVPPGEAPRWLQAKGLMGGDGTIVVGLPPGDDGRETAFWRFAAGAWTAGATTGDLLGLHPLPDGLLVMAAERVSGDGPRRVTVMASRDGGATFASLPLKRGWQQRWRLDPRTLSWRGGVLQFEYGGALMRVDGHGQVVERFAVAPPWIERDLGSVCVHPHDPFRLYGLHPARGLMRSDDGGRTWRAGRGALATLRGQLVFAGGDEPELLVLGTVADELTLTAFRDRADPLLFTEPGDG